MFSSCFQALVLFVFTGIFIAGVYGCMNVEKGLDLADLVPRKSQEYKFLNVHRKYKLSLYHQIAVVIKGGFDYPLRQKLLYDFHDNFSKVRYHYVDRLIFFRIYIYML